MSLMQEVKVNFVGDSAPHMLLTRNRAHLRVFIPIKLFRKLPEVNSRSQKLTYSLVSVKEQI